MKEYNVAIAGATGAVGKVFLSILQERKFPIKNITLLASSRSAGKKIEFCGQSVEVRELKKDSFKNIDIALFSAGAARSNEFAPYAVSGGATVIDNSSAFRMVEGVPLIVPEVNKEIIFSHKGIIANPNCSTIIMAVAIKPIYDISRIKRIVVSTYQAVSGAGAKGIVELEQQTELVMQKHSDEIRPDIFPVQIAFNVIPHIDVFLENGYTKEEMKMSGETKKIFNDPDIKISATAVRVPVFTSHSESISVETEKKVDIDLLKKSMQNAPGISLKDDFKNKVYPTVLDSSGKDDVFIGRIREDISCENSIAFWAVGDQLRKGAALNAIQIAEEIIKR